MIQAAHLAKGPGRLARRKAPVRAGASRLQAVRAPKASSRARYVREFAATSAMVGLLACLGLALVASQTLVAYTGYRVVELKAELGALQGEGQRLDLEIARLSSPDRIEKEAVERLGMCAPGEVRMVAMEVPDPSRDLATESRQGFWRTLAGTLLRGIGRAVAGSP